MYHLLQEHNWPSERWYSWRDNSGTGRVPLKNRVSGWPNARS